MQTIKVNNQTYKGPGDWAELTTANLLSLAVFMSAPGNPGYLVMMLFKIPFKTFARLWARTGLRTQVEPVLSWVYTKNTLSKWLISAVRVSKRKLYGPKHQLSNLTIEEFTYTEAAYESWLQTKNADYIDTLFAVLYRPRRFFTLKRAAFDADKLDKLAKRAEKAPVYIKRAVAINYAGCRNLIIDRHPYIWPPMPPEEQPAAPAAHRPTNWAQLVLNLSGDKFGTYRQTKSELLWVVLADFNKKAKDNKELEDRLKS